ncbi:KUP/HAK/KT family potassium transporter, partial [Streptococcus suis]
AIEFVFFAASAVKFLEGGYVVIVLTLAILSLMLVWYLGAKIISRHVKLLDLNDYKEQLDELKNDSQYPL